MHGSAVWNKLLTAKQSVIPFVGKSTEAGVVPSAVQPSVTSCSKKASASSSSSLAAAPNLRVTSNTHAQNVSGNIPPVVVVCAHPTHKGVDAQLHHALPTPINCETMAGYLVGYNKPDTSMLLDGFSLGFSLHYDGPHCIRCSGNHQSALQAPSLVDDKLRHEMHLGRIAGPFQQVPFPNFQAKLPKHEIGKFRLIHDLSFPKGDSINFYTSKEYTTVQYESLDIVIDLVRSCGHNSLVAKADIQDAFRLVPIRPQDYPLLGFTWNGMFYHDKVLPMGSAVSCQTFERFSRALQWILQTHFGVSKVTHLLDDFIFFGPCNESTCLTSLLSFEKLSQDIGIPLNHGKRCLPSTCQIVYGIEIDTAVMELRLPEDKLTKATSLVNRITNRRKVTLKDLLSLIGLLNFACLVVPPGADLAAWQEFLVSFNGKSMFLEQQFLSSTTIKLYTDASSDRFRSCIWKKMGIREMA